ncbi:MAG: hypothetical protein GX121_07790 [Ignavibacteria bacterium]|nr:hypothetical protein [Ignavibacteria bacterium]
MQLRYLTNENGEKTDVVMKYTDYNDIMEEIEDIRAIAERNNDELIPHSDVMKMFEIVEN